MQPATEGQRYVHTCCWAEVARSYSAHTPRRELFSPRKPYSAESQQADEVGGDDGGGGAPESNNTQRKRKRRRKEGHRTVYAPSSTHLSAYSTALSEEHPPRDLRRKGKPPRSGCGRWRWLKWSRRTPSFALTRRKCAMFIVTSPQVRRERESLAEPVRRSFSTGLLLL